jgi:hypothetical protein
MRENEPVWPVRFFCDGEIILEKGKTLSEKRHIDLGTRQPFTFGAGGAADQLDPRCRVRREVPLLDEPGTPGTQGADTEVDGADGFMLLVLELIAIANQRNGGETCQVQRSPFFSGIPCAKERDGLGVFFNGAWSMIVVL